ncbi:MAP kinase kinase kinase mkh1 [Leucoagaricus sp. SymC.cos]|nr:MAP kinase kinase kinase mkh1 [Leucoagaricus sp. SymC.cos]
MRGTVQYMAPEILGSKGRGYDGKIDIWSVGCMVMEMWSGEKPWGADENFYTIMLKLNEKRTSPPVPVQLQKELPPDAHKFRELCFHINPVQRPSAGELKQHPYLRLPPGWLFDEYEVPHPSRERRVGVKERRRRERQDDATTYRPRRQGVDTQDHTIRPEDIHRNDNSTLQTLRQPAPLMTPRGPSPPIVIIEPLRPNPSPAPSPSPIDSGQEQENGTSESSITSSRTSGTKRKLKYRVVNQGGDPKPYDYVPPSLPPSTQAYSARLGTSAKYNLDYVPEPNPASRSRSSSTPHFQVTPTPVEPSSSSSSPSGQYPSHSCRSSQSSSSTSSLPQSSNGTEDSATWKRPPATAPIRHPRTSSSSSNLRREQASSSSSGHRQAYQLRTPPPPTMPPPLPPVCTPPPPQRNIVPRTPPPPTVPPPLPPPPSPYVGVTPPRERRKSSRAPTTHRRGNRPNADDVVRHLGDYFPDHDLDQQVFVQPSSSLDDLTDRLGNLSALEYSRGNDYTFDEESSIPAPSTSAPSSRATRMLSPSPVRLPTLRRPTSFSRSSSSPSSRPRTGYTTPTNTSDRGLTINRANYHENTIIPNDVSLLEHNNQGTRLGYTKSVRRLAEEQATKRQSNPGKARRRTLWDIKMEEVKGLPPLTGSNQQRRDDSDYDHEP